MAGRPTKQTVDYFPHYCRHGKTLMILEQKYGNDGYALWFKLLEMLGDTDGHKLDFNDPIAWEFFQSKARLPEETCTEILNLLSKLKAIDSELWENKIIWCDNFVQNISDVYRNRVVEIPPKPEILRKKLPDKPISDVRNTHSRVEESREKKSRKDIATLFFSCEFFEVDLPYREKLRTEYPILTDELLNRELSKMEDWLTENRQKKKFKANGTMKNTKLFIKNWLDRTEIKPMAQALCSHGVPPRECRICRDYLPRPNGFPKRS